MEMPNFLSLEEEAALNSTYEEIVAERMREVEAEYEMGAYGPNVTLDEARRIVEYVIGLEVRGIFVVDVGEHRPACGCSDELVH